jgi:kumamolisin
LKLRTISRRVPRAARHPFGIGFALFCSLTSVSLSASAQTATVPLRGHVPLLVMWATDIGSTSARETVSLALVLPLRNEAALDDLLIRLYDPDDPAYGQYLTSQEFTAQFGPTQADYDAMIVFARQNGLTVTGKHDNRLVLDVAGPAKSVETAFGVTLKQYVLPDGRVFRAPDSDPVVPVAIAGRLKSVVGLDTATVWHPHNVRRQNLVAGLFGFNPLTIGSGPDGGLSPSDIKTAYNLSSTTLTGTGQTLGLFELDGYTASDIAAYQKKFGLTAVPLQNILVDTATGKAGSGADEVTLDIELQNALAPGATKILVYEGPNSSKGVIDTYNKIATDNLANSISTSWGEYEAGSGSSTLNSENTIFKQMATQGQSIFAAAGDSGAYDNGSSLSVDDPASQPYVTGAGGTSLTTNGAGGAWSSETTWNGGSINNGAGGGGISSYWTIPSWQPTSLITSANKGSTTYRNVPDVSLDADPNTGYAIYVGGSWNVYGGTSCAAPLWSAFTALVNQQRVANSKSVLGFANPELYAVGEGTDYTADFHDIADGSTNLYYPAVKGYDLATGWGTFNGANLLVDLAGSGTVTPPPPPPTQLIVDPGFENGTNYAPWVATANVITEGDGEAPHSGSWEAWLDGYGVSHTDTLYQQVTIPSTITTATLTFYLHIDTQETTKTKANDTLNVEVRNSSGTVLSTLATYSNLNAATGYTLKTFSLSAYKGQTIQIYLIGTENNSLATSFVVDDFALNVQ